MKRIIFHGIPVSPSAFICEICGQRPFHFVWLFKWRVCDVEWREGRQAKSWGASTFAEATADKKS